MVLKSGLTLLLLAVALQANAAIIPKSTSADARMRQVTYDPNNVVLLKSHYGYQTDIEFAEDEIIENVAIGDAGVWQAVPTNNHLFIKPMALSKTNMTVLTNERSYQFLLESSDEQNKSQTFRLQFYYPANATLTTTHQSKRSSAAPMDYNWKYSYSGDKSLAPLQVFDDKKFTYFKFKNPHANPLPALFIVNPDHSETLVNYHMEEDFVVVNRVANQFTLRHGKQSTCVYNNLAMGDWQKIK